MKQYHVKGRIEHYQYNAPGTSCVAIDHVNDNPNFIIISALKRLWMPGTY